MRSRRLDRQGLVLGWVVALGVAATFPVPSPGEWVRNNQPAPLLAPFDESHLVIPVEGVPVAELADTFSDSRSGGRRHEAIDILAPRGTPVLAAVDGEVVDITPNHSLGGLSVYQVDAGRRRCYYYAHLEALAPGLEVGAVLVRGETLGTVGTSGNAPKDTPHLHFAVFEISEGEGFGSCFGGTPVNPYSVLRRAS